MDLSAIGLDMEMQPLLRILYETGVLDIISLVFKLGTNWLVERIWDEVLIPLFLTIPGFWTYVPQEDYRTAKRVLFKGDAKYAGLVDKLDTYRREVMDNADRLILEASAKIKVGVRAGYNLPSWPLVKGADVQSDNSVETFRASLGATCAPLGGTLGLFYRQKRSDGHNHISPDNVIDASTCLLPDRTWFAKNRPHGPETSYSGWYEWFLRTSDATVFGNAAYPQFCELVAPGTFVPLVVPRTRLLVELLTACGLQALKVWRFVITIPLYWVNWL